MGGQFNVYNALAAVAVGRALGLSLAQCAFGVSALTAMPGRMERIEAGQDFIALVDYAPEPESMKKLYETLDLFKFNKIIHVLGSCGGGRDQARRPILGKLAAEHAAYVIVTNEDPYDENPQAIIDQVAQGAIAAGKILNENLFKIIDRKNAIKKALSLAEENDLVLLTGKGSEQFICVARGQKIPWDERKVVRELLKD